MVLWKVSSHVPIDDREVLFQPQGFRKYIELTLSTGYLQYEYNGSVVITQLRKHSYVPN